MGRISDDWLNELMSKVNMEQIVGEYCTLVNRGGRYWACCPFHNEKTPSFTINTEKKFYKCFGCGKGGTLINFIMDIENLSFRDACVFLAEKVGMRKPDLEPGDDVNKRKREKLIQINKDAARFFYISLFEKENRQGLEYFIRKRKLSKDTIDKFKLGFADAGWDSTIKYLESKGHKKEDILAAGLCKKKDDRYYDVFRNRPVMPIVDKLNNVIGFGGRALSPEDMPKYLNTAETLVFNKRKNVYNLNHVRTIKDLDYIILAEGYMDVIALSSHGFENAVATLGTSLTEDQARLIKNYTGKVFVSYDGDSAGIKAALRAVDILAGVGLEAMVVLIPGSMDPDEFLDRYGSDAYAKLIEKAYDRVGFKLACVKSRYDLTTAVGKESYAKAAIGILKKETSAIIVEKYAKAVSADTGFSVEAILADIGDIRSDLDYELPNNTVPDEDSLTERYLMARMVESPAAIKVIAEDYGISGEDFMNPSYGRIFDTALDCVNSGKEVSSAVLLTELEDEKDRFTATVLFDSDPDDMVPGKNRDTFLLDCVSDFNKKKLEREKQKLLDEYKNTEDPERKKELLAEVNELNKLINAGCEKVKR